jgi:hypothetical protein
VNRVTPSAVDRVRGGHSVGAVAAKSIS